MSVLEQPPATIHIRHAADAYGNAIWYFGDHAIRVDESGPKPMFCLKDCLEANGLNHRGSRQSRYMQEHLGVSSFLTPGGTQSLVTISEQGFYVLSMRGHKPVSEGFRRWLAEVVTEI